MNGYLHESANELEPTQETFSTGPGGHLKKRRESLGLTHADIAGHLNLRISVIEAIEDNNYKHIPKLVFARGYLRAYAKLLGLPGNEIIESFNQLECPENPSELPASPLRTGQKKPLKKEHSLMPWIALLVLILIFVAVGFWKPITSFLTQVQPTQNSTPVIVEEPKAVVNNVENNVPASTGETAESAPSQESSIALPDLDQFKQENQEN